MDLSDLEEEVRALRKRCHDLANAVTLKVDRNEYLDHRERRATELGQLADRLARLEEAVSEMKVLKVAALVAFVTGAVGLLLGLKNGG